MDCSLPGFSVHGIFQARVLEWVAISFSKESSWPRDRTQVSCIADRCFTLWATNSPLYIYISSFFFFSSFISLFILLYNFVLVLPYTDLNPPWVYMCSPSWTPLPPLSPSHPSGSSQCTSPEHPVSCIEPELVIRFIYDSIHVYFPKSFHSLPLPQSPKDCSIHLYLFCSLAYRVIVTIFLNSIYMR